MSTIESKNPMSKCRCFLATLCILLLRQGLWAQENFPPDTLSRKRLNAVAISAGAAYVGSMTALYGLWYSDYESTSFQFFDDSKQWLGMDKAGHALTAYQISRYGYGILRWTGLEKRKSMWWSSGVSLLFLTNVEVFDAYSKGWGFSWSDFAANVSGAGLFVGQELLWQEQRMMLKFSYSESGLAEYRPELLGSGTTEKIFKDYNGQTVWLSVSPGSFLKDQKIIPDWLCFSLGYSGQNMLGGSSNPDFNEGGEALPELNRYRQYYLSLDVDLTKIKTKSRFFNTFFSTFAILKVPAPTVEFSQGQTQWHWLYF
ncbi:MAG: DUF2279 domain-containing protein [Cryomorphaceae bacterium]